MPMSPEPFEQEAPRRRPGSGEGVGVDYLGGPVKDPTENVRQDIKVVTERQDSLRNLNDRRIDAELKVIETKLHSVQREMYLRAEHQKELAEAESARINAIRQVDREEVVKTAAAANRAIETLAAAASATAETLRTQTAAGMAEINKRVSALETAYSEGRGKQTVADPMVAQMMTKLEALVTSGAASTGKGEGSKATVAYVITGISMLFGLISTIIALSVFLTRR